MRTVTPITLASRTNYCDRRPRAKCSATTGRCQVNQRGTDSLNVKLAIKCLVTALLLWLAFRTVDLAAVGRLIGDLNPGWAAAAFLLTGLIIVSDAMLLESVLKMFARRIPFRTALLYSLVGWFFSNVAPSTVGGDIFRGVQLSRVGTPVGAAVRVILSVRLLSFATLVAVIIAGIPIAAEIVRNGRDLLILAAIAASGCAALIGILLFAHVPRSGRLERWPLVRKVYTLSEDFRRLLTPSSRGATSWLAALSQHVVRVAILAALSSGLSLNISFATLFALTPAALLVAMVPVSFGGWGVRELTFVYFLGTAGVSAEASLSLSIAFGLLRVVVGAIGGVTWAFMSEHHFRVDAPPA